MELDRSRSDDLPLRSSGIALSQREQLFWPSGRPFKILSIDGGGIRGVLPAKFLAELEDRYLEGRPIGEYFDLIAGTSTGGIIALGLAVGRTAGSILKLYENNAAKIFPANWLQRSIRRNVFLDFVTRSARYRYDRKALASALHNEFQELIIGNATIRVCIPTFDDNSEINVLKTPHHPDYRTDWSDTLCDAALKTSAAPTYFSAHSLEGRRYLDGGVWANNPIMVGLIDVLACYDVPRRDIHILSLGCAEGSVAISEGMLVKSGAWHWKNIISAAMKLQSENALGQAGLLIGRDRIVRLDTTAFQGHDIGLDDWETSLAALPQEAIKLVDGHGELVRREFLSEIATPYIAHSGPRSVR